MCDIYNNVFSEMMDMYCLVDFQGSSILAVDYDPKSLTTIITINFCNRAQSLYDGSEPEFLKLYLRFERSFVEIVPNTSLCTLSGEIRSFEHIDEQLVRFVVGDNEENDSDKEIVISADIVYFRDKMDDFDCHNCVIAESEHYAIIREKEECILAFKDGRRKSITAGDFYGEAEFALIDKNESFVVMGGCGIIIYFLQEPWEPYWYNCPTSQWVEIGRGDKPIYYESVKQLNDTIIEITDAKGNRFVYDTNNR